MDNVSIINEDKEENINVSDTIQENINNNISDTIQEEHLHVSLVESSSQIKRKLEINEIPELKSVSAPGHKFDISITCNKHYISLFENEHNHELRSDTCEFNSRYREISKEIMDEIEIMTKHANLSITVQHNLLKARFPKINYTDSDLSNAIQRIKIISRSNMHNDASDLLIGLVQKKQENPHFFLNLNLMLIIVLCGLLENFPLAKDYLLRVLWPSNKSWARCYLKQIFTAGIESTSRVEGMNAIIKKTVRSNSTLCQLVDQLSEHLFQKFNGERFHEYDLQLLVQFHRNGTMSISPSNYHLFSELDFTQEQEIEAFIEYSYDAQQITLQSIIDEIERWYQDVYQGKPLTQETVLIFLHENENLENNTNNDLEIRIPTRKAITIPKTVPIMKKAIEKRKKYGKLWDYINKKKRNYEMISESNTEIEMEQNHINESTNISNEFQELGNIQNPLKAKTKGRPPTKDIEVVLSMKREKVVKVVVQAEIHINVVYVDSAVTMQHIIRMTNLKNPTINIVCNL
ncbi:unnamed protein product [Rhizophagus irregularis]|nr:unnamed protein product [Rhizophagus irregularis]